HGLRNCCVASSITFVPSGAWRAFQRWRCILWFADAPIYGTPAIGSYRLLTFAVPDHLLDLLLHRIEIEGCRVLPRRVVDRRLRQLCDVLLNHDEAPELTGEEADGIARGAGVPRLAAKIRRALERILANVDQAGHVRGDLFARPAPRLRKERELEVVDANRAQLRTAEVEQLLALGRALAGEKIHLVVAIEMVLVGSVAELHALQQWIGDVRVPRRGHQGREPIEAGEEAVLDG